jgi:hypothetical protein
MNSNYLIGQLSVIAIVAFLITLAIAKLAKWQTTGDLFFQRDKRFWSTFVVVIIVWTGAGTLILNHSTPLDALSKSAAADQLTRDEQPLAKSMNGFSKAGGANIEKFRSVKNTLDTFSSKILDQSWPSYAKKDINTLSESASSLSGDFELYIASNTAINSSSRVKFSTDLYAFYAKLKILEHDLGIKVSQ